MNRQWTPQEAWTWYDRQPWIVGCNFIPRDCTGFFDIWQEMDWEKKLDAMRVELTLAAGIGMNSVRMVMPFFVWLRQHDGFMRRLDEFLAMADELGITMMCCFFDDCSGPKKFFREPVFGKQRDPVPGFHGGFPPPPPLLPEEDPTGYTYLDIPEYQEDIARFVTDIVSTHAKDPRIVVWDVMNEPGNGNRGSKSLAWLEKGFALIRAQDPIQPVCAGPWIFSDGYQCFATDNLEIEKRAFELSDIINFHFYGNLEDSKKVIEKLEKFGRPLVITEWLHRCYQNRVETHLPLYKEHRVGCYNWGLVAGKTQTYEPWESVRTALGADLTVWQHDLFHADHSPYDPEELRIFRELTGRGVA